ncbi:MAG: B12-binding domain-containing radical SAM protein, partial [Desulfuromonadaceae bacterium]|nr:B12-binding domain-containing radical SAM protein [Desulfuromonadaceae bacterium]
MKILLVYPRYPATFWSFRYAMKFINRKASFPPLGLLTVAAMLPGEWEKKLVDMNVSSLADQDLRWADYVFISAMTIQRQSAQKVIDRCRGLGIKTVAGGPLFTSCPDDFPKVDHLVLGEGEVTLPSFLEDLRRGAPRRIYAADKWAQLRDTPIPRWELVKMRDYAAMNIQYGRGCPYDCEFCDITGLFGRSPRSKNPAQLLAELESLYAHG